MEVGRSVTCQDCGLLLQEPTSTPTHERQPCPRCGSKARLVKLHLQSSVTVRSTLGLKGRSGPGRPFVEMKVGESLHKLTGLWNWLEQIVDRRNNRYRKRVVDARTGQILKDVDVPLTDHQGYGSARKTRPQPKS